jgi:hypothetical protein
MSVGYCGMQHSFVSHYIQDAMQLCVAFNFLLQLAERMDKMEQTRNKFRILMGEML